jgi:hydrogenase nickel incorporation protein HypA/HybF
MHEMAITCNILQHIEENSIPRAYQKVKIVRLEIGVLSCIEPESIRFCFETISAGTIVEGAILEIIRIPGQAKCLSCEQSIIISQRYDPCPECGGFLLQITGGEEMIIKELEVE